MVDDPHDTAAVTVASSPRPEPAGRATTGLTQLGPALHAAPEPAASTDTAPRTVQHRIELADGRHLIYFDAGTKPRQHRSAPDRRAREVSPPPSDVRWDPLFEDYSVIAAHRQGRTFKPVTSECPLCPSIGDQLTEIPAPDYEVAVFENRYPAFAPGATRAVATPGTTFATAPAAGRCEVVCFTSEHGRSFADLDPAQARTVIDAWSERTRELGTLDSVRYVLCFENRGEDIGVTLSHPHGQIYGYPFVPPRFDRASAAAERHLETAGRCLQCDQLTDELAGGTRVVTCSKYWVAYVPFAARWPYEVRIVPRQHVPDLPSLSDDQRDDLAELYLDVLRRFDELFNAPAPYIAAWLQAPTDRSGQGWHLAAEIFTVRRAPGRLKYLAGAESSAATWINDIAPEIAAERLRSVKTHV